MLYYSGCLAGVAISAFLLKYLCNRTWILITYAVFTLGMIAVSRTSALLVFLLLLLLIGIATKFLDLTINTEISEYHEEHKGFYINLLHGCFGAGSFAGPILAAKLLGVMPRWQMIYGYIGIVCLLLFAAFCIKGKAPARPAAETDYTKNQNRMNWKILKNPHILCLIMALFFYCGHQGGISTWVPLYLQYQYGAGIFTASLGSSLFWVGLFAGAAIPLILTMGYKECPDSQSTVSVIFFLSISTGQIVFPWIMGIICGTLGLTWGMLSNVLCLIGTVIFVILYLKSGRKKPKAAKAAAGIQE